VGSEGLQLEQRYFCGLFKCYLVSHKISETRYSFLESAWGKNFRSFAWDTSLTSARLVTWRVIIHLAPVDLTALHTIRAVSMSLVHHRTFGGLKCSELKSITTWQTGGRADWYGFGTENTWSWRKSKVDAFSLFDKVLFVVYSTTNLQ
jgi:hypothetical protein